jgi:hypothetical protein
LAVSAWSPTESVFVPSPRLLAVAALVVMGGLAGVISAGGDGSPGSSGAQQPTSAVRGGLVSHPAGTAIAVENQKTGDRDWRIAPARGSAAGLAAYAGAVSAKPGDQVPLHLKGNGEVRTRAYRLGWYGGAGARKVWEGTLTATPQTGAAPTWTSNATLNTTGWPQGTYLIRLDLGPASRYVPLTVTSGGSAATAKVVVLTSPMTWAATNRNGSAAPGRKVTLNRPLVTGSGGGGLVADTGLIAQIERTGVQVVYQTDAGLAADPGLIDGAAAVLVDGDSRYWTAKMRIAVRSAVAAGTDVAFFGAGSAGATAVLNPTDPRTFTVGPLAATPAARLTGSVATCVSPGRTGLKVSDPAWWGFQGGDVKAGEVLKGLVSGSLEKVSAPSGAEVVGSAELGCGDTQTTISLQRPSGARIFTAGTAAWACTVSGACPDAQGKRIKANVRAQKVAALVTRNVVETFGKAQS